MYQGKQKQRTLPSPGAFYAGISPFSVAQPAAELVSKLAGAPLRMVERRRALEDLQTRDKRGDERTVLHDS